MKAYIARVNILEAVPSTEYPQTNSGYNSKGEYYAVIEENQPTDEESVRVEFVMWTAGIPTDKVTQIVSLLNGAQEAVIYPNSNLMKIIEYIERNANKINEHTWKVYKEQILGHVEDAKAVAR